MSVWGGHELRKLEAPSANVSISQTPKAPDPPKETSPMWQWGKDHHLNIITDIEQNSHNNNNAPSRAQRATRPGSVPVSASRNRPS